MNRRSLQTCIWETKASPKACAVVLKIMQDGQPRHDERIWLDSKHQYTWSASAIRHARLALVKAGMLIDTRVKARTRQRSWSRVWKKA